MICNVIYNSYKTAIMMIYPNLGLKVENFGPYTPLSTPQARQILETVAKRKGVLGTQHNNAFIS